MDPKKLPKASGIGLGLTLGVAIGAATDNLGLWISLGVAIGAALETAIKKSRK